MPETTVHAILTQVEQLDPAASGAFVVELAGQPVAYVFVEHNRVCWAGAWQLRRRLKDLLREQLGETTEKSSAMRVALERHTVESLVSLPQAQGEVTNWIPRSVGLQPRFTFSPVDLFVATNAFLYSTERKATDAALSILEPDVRGASFVIGDDDELVPVCTHGSYKSIADLDELGTWAHAAFGVTRGFSPEVIRRAIDSGSGEVALAWRTSRSAMHAAVLARGDSLERLVTTVERRGFPAVLSNRQTR